MKKMLAILMILGLVCSSSGLALSATAQQAAPAATAPAPAAQPAPKAAPQKMEAGYRGNPESKIYHNSSCRYYKGKSVSKTFASPADAKGAGDRPCKVCKG